MRVQITRSTSLQVVGPKGPANRVLAVGEVVELPSIQARIFIANGNAKLAGEATKASAPVKDEVTASDDTPTTPAKKTPAKKSR